LHEITLDEAMMLGIEPVQLLSATRYDLGKSEDTAARIICRLIDVGMLTVPY